MKPLYGIAFHLMKDKFNYIILSFLQLKIQLQQCILLPQKKKRYYENEEFSIIVVVKFESKA